MHGADSTLVLTARSTRLLGLVSSLFGAVIIVAYGYFNRFHHARPYFMALGLIVWFAPGLVFLAAAHGLTQMRKSAASIGMLIAGFQSLCAAALLVAFCTLPPVSPIPIILCLLWLAALGQLMLLLQRSSRLIRVNVEHRRGFELGAARGFAGGECRANTCGAHMIPQKPIRSRISQAAGGAKLVGGLFIVLGSLPMLGVAFGRAWVEEVLSVSTTLITVSPGVWYVIAGVFLRRGQYWAVKTTYRIALGQFLCLVLAFFGGVISSQNREIIVPAVLLLFFIPALIALMFDMHRAHRELISGAGRGFAVHVLPVVPNVEEPQMNTDEHR